MGQVTGIVKIKVNGNLQRSKDGAKLNIGGKEREAVTGHSVYGYTEKVVPATVEFTLAHTGDTDLRAINDTVGATIEFVCDTGVTYIVANAFCTKAPELTGGSGDVSCSFYGDPAVPA